MLKPCGRFRNRHKWRTLGYNYFGNKYVACEKCGDVVRKTYDGQFTTSLEDALEDIKQAKLRHEADMIDKKATLKYLQEHKP